MAKLAAPFSTSGNDPKYYPDTPFQILHAVVSVQADGDGYLQTGQNSFEVEPGTRFFVPLWNATDSPPVAGVFPTTHAAAKRYFFRDSQLGARGFEITVDRKNTKIGPAYVAGPVRARVLDDDGLADTPLGTHIVTLGAFLSPLSRGSHTVRIRGGLYGDLVPGATGGAAFLREDITYTVNVKPR